MSDNDERGMYAPPTSGLNADFFSRATDMSTELFDLDMLLAGKRLDDEGEWTDDAHREPLLNAEGRAMIKTLLSTVLNKNTYMSDLRAERVRDFVFETSEDFQITLFFNRQKYGLTDDKIWAYGYIVSLVENFLETALARPIEGRERNMYNTMVTEQSHRIVESKQDQGSGGLLSGLLQRGKSKF